MDSLIANRTIIPNEYAENNYPVYNILCKATGLNLTVQLGEQVITIDRMSLLIDGPGDFPNYCQVKLQPYREYGYGPGNVGYTNQPSWIFGAAFINQICLSYNYADNTLGVGFPKLE
jgi:hypothetical protein